MANIFNQLQKTVFDIAGKTFGNKATWEPRDGGDTQTATVLYNDPSEKYGMSDIEFQVDGYRAEYLSTDFIGLKESVDNSGIERITIETDVDNNVTFMVRRIVKKYDGKTIVAYLSPVDL